MAVKTNEKRASLRRGTQRSYEHKDDGSGSGIFKLPSGVSFIKWEKDTKYRHLIIAFPAGKNHPLVKSGDFKEGEYVSSVEFHVHKGLGADGKKSAICMKQTYNKKCAVCDYADEMRNKGKSEVADQLKPKKQVAYIIYDVKAGKKEFKVLSAPHFCFEKGLVEAARNASEDDNGFVDYPYLENEGAIVRYMVKEESFKNRKFLTLADGTNFKEITKDDELPVKFLDSPFCLDDCMSLPSYEEVEKILFSSGDEDDEDDEKHENSDEDDEKHEDDENECPHGHTFGKDCDDEDHAEDCDECKVYNDCKKAKKGKK